MNKYLRLMRLKDQYFELGAVLAAGLTLNLKSAWIIWWGLSATLISIAILIVNEIADRKDVDKYSWNPIHIPRHTKLDHRIVLLLVTGCALLGLALASLVNLFWWALAILVVGIAYSLEPVRLKRLPVFDIAAQLGVWWVLPFLGPIVVSGNLKTGLPVLVNLSFLVWSCFYPYQLSDFKADKRACLRGTHIRLGFRNSLWLGLILGLIGVALFLTRGLFASATWSWAFVLLEFGILYLYVHWLRMEKSQALASMQNLVGKVKPFHQLLLLYLLLAFLFQ